MTADLFAQREKRVHPHKDDKILTGWNGLMIAALAIRIVIPQFAPGAYLACIHAAATCWLLAFGILAWRYIPLLMQARIDGREH